MTTCRVCGQGFTAKRSDARYCSPACRQKAYRDRHVWVRWVRLTEQMVGRYPDEAGADEVRKLAERFVAIIQAQQTQENDQDKGKLTRKRREELTNNDRASYLATDEG